MKQHNFNNTWYKMKSRNFSMLYNLQAKSISTSYHMFMSAIWDKLTKCIFENFEIARVKRGKFQKFRKSRG